LAIDGEVQPPADEPAHRRAKDAIEQADNGKKNKKNNQPEGKSDGVCHPFASLS
jgi:hypothetical protein